MQKLQAVDFTIWLALIICIGFIPTEFNAREAIMSVAAILLTCAHGLVSARLGMAGMEDIYRRNYPEIHEDR
jgi:hypothetical protein